jgi:ATP-dependent protease ClpP protease subunit
VRSQIPELEPEDDEDEEEFIERCMEAGFDEDECQLWWDEGVYAMEGTRSLITNGELILYGVIDPESWFEDSVRAIDVLDSIATLPVGSPVVARINSPGGSLEEGIAIYNLLRASQRRIEIVIDAMAASAASIVAMAGDSIKMMQGSTMMLHDPWAMVVGNADDLRSSAEIIDMQRDQMIDIYSKRSGLSRDEIGQMMKAETYLTAQQAKAKGFADLIDEAPMRVAACAKLDAASMAKLLRAKPTIAAPAAQTRSYIMNRTPENGGTPAVPTPSPLTPEQIEAARAIFTQAAANPNQPTPQPEPKPQPSPPHQPPHQPQPEPKPGTIVDIQAATRDAIAAERGRVAGITQHVRAAKLPPEFAEELVNSGISLDDARDKIYARWNEIHTAPTHQENPPINGINAIITVDQLDKWIDGVSKGLMARANMKGGERNEFSGLTLSELARSSLQLRGVKSGAMDRMTMIGAAFTVRAEGPGYHSTSDFGNILGNVAHRAMMIGYEEVEETFPLWTGKGTATDFRPIARIDLGLFPGLDKVEEGGEYKYGTIADTGTSVQIATYGKMFAITRQAIVNDDLGFFNRVPRKMGRGAKRTIGNLVYAIINGNPVMQDGVALFATAHGNLAPTPAVPSVTSVGAARAAMARQTDEAGIGTAIGVSPKFALTPPEYAMVMNTVMTSERIPGDAGQISNPVRGVATPIYDTRLNGTAWYLISDPQQVDTVEVTYLDGVETPFMDQREGWNVDGAEFKVRIDAGVKALHWRGLYKNAGA